MSYVLCTQLTILDVFWRGNYKPIKTIRRIIYHSSTILHRHTEFIANFAQMDNWKHDKGKIHKRHLLPLASEGAMPPLQVNLLIIRQPREKGTQN